MGGASRQVAQACARTRAFLARGGAERPAFRALRDVRKRPLTALCDVGVEVLRSAGESGVVKRGHGSPDGSQLQGKAARHTAMRDGSMQKEVARRREAIDALVTPAAPPEAEAEAALGRWRGDAWPAEGARREDRRATREAARQRREARAPAAGRSRGRPPAHGPKAARQSAPRGGRDA